MRSDVGDTPLDMRAAQEAGARAVVVATGFADREALHASRPDAFLEDLADTAAAVAVITGST
jgi:phosphoglycolate phosphatase-like HAD superfamily hydrolase